MDAITQYIYIGNFQDARGPLEGFESVLCLADECEDREDVALFHIPLIDGAGNNPDRVAEALAVITDSVKAQQKILVHCHAGRSRSVTVVARWMMKNEGISATEAILRIKARRHIYMNPGIEDILRWPL